MDEMNVIAAEPPAATRAASVSHLSVADYGAGLRDGTYGTESTVRHLLARIDEVNATLDAFTFVDAEGSLAAARAIDAHLAARTDLGPLMGVPIAIKDIYAATGLQMKAGTRGENADGKPSEEQRVQEGQRGGGRIRGETRTSTDAGGAGKGRQAKAGQQG